jgi:hypothetical protein
VPLLWDIQNVTVTPDTDIEGLQVTMKSGVRVSGQIAVEGSGARTPTAEQLRAVQLTASGAGQQRRRSGRNVTRHRTASRRIAFCDG